MKKTVTLIAAILISIYLKADGGSPVYIIKFSIEKTNKQVSKGYSYVIGDLNIDSLNNSEYLKRLLDQSDKDWGKRDSLTYYKGKLKFEYNDIRDGSEAKICLYTLTDKNTLSFKAIKSIKIDTVMSHYFDTAISNDLKMADTIWLKKAPIRKVVLKGYLCYFQIFIFANSPQISEVLKKIDILQKEYNRLEEENNNSVDDRMNDIEQEYFKLLRKLDRQKLVIVEECSC